MQLIIDGANLTKRTWKGSKLLTTSSGKHVNTIFGVIRSIKTCLEKFNPDSVHFTWDAIPIKRKEIYSEYKKKRHTNQAKSKVEFTPEQEEDYLQFIQQCNDLRELLPLLGIHQYKGKGVEADDLIAVLSMGLGQSIIVSMDSDFNQLVSPSVRVYRPLKDDILTIDNFESIIGLPTPEMFLQARLLMGDSSDEIPGIGGFQEKKAFPLIRKHITAEAVRQWALQKVATERTTDTIKTLASCRDTLVRNDLLMNLKHSVHYLYKPIEEYKREGKFNRKELKDALIKLEFFSFMHNFDLFCEKFKQLQ